MTKTTSMSLFNIIIYYICIYILYYYVVTDDSDPGWSAHGPAPWIYEPYNPVTLTKITPIYYWLRDNNHCKCSRF